MRKEEVRIAIAGCGGIGGNVAMILVRSGFKRFRLVDFDVVNEGNLNRQFFFHDQLGASKVQMLATNLLRIDPTLDLRLSEERLTAERAASLLQDCDIIVEGFDGKEQKQWLAQIYAGRDCFYVGANGIGGLQTHEVRRQKIGKSVILWGDGKSDVTKEPPRGPKVLLVAALMANEILKQFEGDSHGISKD